MVDNSTSHYIKAQSLNKHSTCRPGTSHIYLAMITLAMLDNSTNHYIKAQSLNKHSRCRPGTSHIYLAMRTLTKVDNSTNHYIKAQSLINIAHYIYLSSYENVSYDSANHHIRAQLINKHSTSHIYLAMITSVMVDNILLTTTSRPNP